MTPFDLLSLAFAGIAVAFVPIAWVWIGRARGTAGGRLRRLAWATAFLTFDLVVFGGFTRLTDSGLGCPDWPGCYAKANPFRASGAIRQAEALLPTGPVTMEKAWIEMIHRYLAMAVGLLIVTMLVVSVVRRRRARRDGSAGRAVALPGMAAALLGVVVLQGAFGAWTVTQRLQPIFVATHLMLGLTLLALLVLHALRLDSASSARSLAAAEVARTGGATRLHAAGLFAAAVVQIALGGWVSANYAVLACTDFPTCHGVWWPSMDFVAGFTPWRRLGLAADGTILSGAALTAIHWTHRAFALVVFVAGAAFAARTWNDVSLRMPARALAGLLVVQAGSGLANVVFAWPLVAAVLHNAGAAALVALLVVINWRASSMSRTGRVTLHALETDRPVDLGRSAVRAPLGGLRRPAH